MVAAGGATVDPQRTGHRHAGADGGEYLKRWGYTAKRPCRHAKKQDPEEVDQWREKTDPAIEERAAAEGAEIHWCDETGAAADEHPGRGYALEGSPSNMIIC